jgi:hypothetical protein
MSDKNIQKLKRDQKYFFRIDKNKNFETESFGDKRLS